MTPPGSSPEPSKLPPMTSKPPPAATAPVPGIAFRPAAAVASSKPIPEGSRTYNPLGSLTKPRPPFPGENLPLGGGEPEVKPVLGVPPPSIPAPLSASSEA